MAGHAKIVINNIQILRALAAVAVVLYHAQFKFFGHHTQFQGVDVFFVISGFIMAKVSQTEGNEFLWKRLIRIVPAYWFVTIISFYLFSIGATSIVHTIANVTQAFATDPASITAWLTTLNWGEWGRLLIKSLLFMPEVVDGKVAFPFIAVGWSLNVEMLFYVLFAGALVLSRKYSSLMVCCSLVALFVAGLALRGWSPVLDFYSQPFLFYFIAGVGVFYTDRWVSARSVKLNKVAVFVVALAATLNLVGCAVAPRLVGQLYGPLAGFMLYAGPVALVSTWLLLSQTGMDIKNRPLVFMGAVSYSLYLVHMPVIILIEQFSVASGMVQGSWFIVGLTLVISFGLAMILHKLVELPFAKALRGGRVISQPVLVRGDHH